LLNIKKKFFINNVIQKNFLSLDLSFFFKLNHPFFTGSSLDLSFFFKLNHPFFTGSSSDLSFVFLLFILHLAPAKAILNKAKAQIVIYPKNTTNFI